MKYLNLIVIIFLLSSCTYYNEETEDYNYLSNDSLRFIRTEEDTSILIHKDNIYYLLLLGNPNVDIQVDYLIKYRNVKTNIKSDKEYLLKDVLSINDITFKLNNKIEINFNGQNICIYIKELDRDDYDNCTFIYLYNPDKDFYITLNNDLLGLFYHSYTKFNYNFMHHLGYAWIDSFTIDTSSYTTLTINEDDFQVTSNKIRGKTIHKKES